MISKFTMPKSGHLMEEGTVACWKKNVGDFIKKGEALLDIEADKGVFEAESMVSGVVKEILVQEQQTVPVGTPLAIIETNE